MTAEQDLRDKLTRLEAALRYIIRIAIRKGDDLIEQVAEDALEDIRE